MTADASLQPLDKKGRPIHPHMWKKGTSGNPKGRPKGCKNKTTKQAQILAQGMLNDEVVLLVRKLLEKALEGDMTAMKLCIERILPPLKEPMEPKQIQHAIEVVLKEPLWPTASIEPPTIDGIAFTCLRRKQLSNPRDEFVKQFRQDILDTLLQNDGENFRLLMQKAKKSKSQRMKKDAERLSKHPALKHLVPR